MPAPEPLLLVQAFVSTRDLDLGTDLLAEAETGNDGLRLSGLLAADATAGPDDLRAARDVRECIRALITHNGGGPEPAEGPGPTSTTAPTAAGGHGATWLPAET
jgi:hypothetical protein